MISFLGFPSPEADFETRIFGKCFIYQLHWGSQKASEDRNEAQLCPTCDLLVSGGAPSKCQEPLHLIWAKAWVSDFHTICQSFWLNLNLNEEQDSLLRESYAFPLGSAMSCGCRENKVGHTRPGSQTARVAITERDRWANQQNIQELEGRMWKLLRLAEDQKQTESS